jgi:hypothetical protein
MQHRIVDTQHQGVIVGSFEHPDAWSAESTVVWNYQNVSHPVVGFSRAFRPDTTS